MTTPDPDDTTPAEDAAEFMRRLFATPREKADYAVDLFVKRAAEQLADCISFLELNMRDDPVEHLCEKTKPVLKRLGPGLFPVVTFFTGVTMHLLEDAAASHRTAGCCDGTRVIDETLAAARMSAASQVDATERMLRNQVRNQYGESE